MAQDDANACAQRGLVNIFPRRQFCQSKEHSIGMNAINMRGVYNNKHVQISASALDQNPALAYVSNLYDGTGSLADQQWSLIYYTMIDQANADENNTLELPYLQIQLIQSQDQVEGAKDVYWDSDTDDWRHLDCNTQHGIEAHGYAFYDSDTQQPNCECQAFHVKQRSTCVPGCAISVDEDGVYQSASGKYCDQPLVEGKASLNKYTQYITVEGNAYCYNGFMPRFGVCQIDKQSKKYAESMAAVRVMRRTFSLIAGLILFVCSLVILANLCDRYGRNESAREAKMMAEKQPLAPLVSSADGNTTVALHLNETLPLTSKRTRHTKS